MIDIVSVVFGEELPILSCQAQSLDLYCQDLGIRNIFVMVNEPNLSSKIDVAWWGSLGDRVVLLPREAFDVSWLENGWVNQQLLKMLGAALSQNTWSMILDAKTVITQPLTQDRLLTAEGKIKLGWIPTIEVFAPAQRIANEIFQSKNDQTLAPAGVPFFFHNQSVREMINDLESRTQQDFKSWFLAQGLLTEFVLYSTWTSIDTSRKALYDAPSLEFRVCNICHSVVDSFDDLIGLHDDTTVSLSIHRRAWHKLSTKQKEIFRDRLVACGISRAGELP